MIFYKILIFPAFLAVLLSPFISSSQTVIVGFYNCENFYDTIDQHNIIDEEFTPQSKKTYSQLKFQNKINHLASVINGMGQLETAKGIALLGVAEIENKMVLQQLVESPLLKKYHLKFIHFDSKDARGIDVALIYNPSFFTPYLFRPYSLTDSSHFQDFATRDILYVQGLLDKTWVHILVNHWPSRRGGSSEARTNRIWAATNCKRIMDSINKVDKKAFWIVMGDFNDNPTNKSIRTLGLDNPFMPMFKQGLGSLAFRDSWNLFDQILLSRNWQKLEMSIKYYKSTIYKTNDMVEVQGKYAGYPKRTWNGDVFRGGYSDHFPVALIFRPNNVENPLK